MIWAKRPTLEALNARQCGTIHDVLGISITEIGDSYLEGTMPVDARTFQPLGYLHGGASAVLAESLGSIASILVVWKGERLEDCPPTFGLELSISHLNAGMPGSVTGRASALRIGRGIHVWEIRLRQQERAISVARLTVRILESRRAAPDLPSAAPS